MELILILGSRGAGRRAIIADLIENGLREDATTVVALSQNEPDTAADAPIIKHPNVTLSRWHRQDETGLALLPPLDETPCEALFFVMDGEGNPADQIETFQTLQKISGGELLRVITVVDCALLEAHESLFPWYEACIHFSDVVLLNNRTGVSNKWLKNFQTHFEKACCPSLFELVKKGRIRNPALILDNQPRRLSHLFDDIDPVDELEFDEDDELPDEPFDLTRKPDPYLERDSQGRRLKELPPIAPILAQWQRSSNNEE